MRSNENSVPKTFNISLIRRYEGEDLKDLLRNEILQNYLIENIGSNCALFAKWANFKYFETTNCWKMDWY